MKKKRLLVVVLALVALIPAYAVLNEKDLSQTLSVLRYELRSAWKASSERAQRTMSRGARQRAQLVEMMQRSRSTTSSPGWTSTSTGTTAWSIPSSACRRPS